MSHELDDDHVAAICRVLIEHEVRFVVIGGVAARLHDTGYATVDVDVCPATNEDNLARLAATLIGSESNSSARCHPIPHPNHYA